MGNFVSAFFPPKSLFTVDQIPDLTGQVIIVTGGNTGIGKETCKVLMNKGAKVYLAARDKVKAHNALEWLKNETGGKVAFFLELDLANLSSVRKAAEEFKSKEQELHVLFNNAGVMTPPVDLRTSDGYDLQFGTNVLGHYLFTTLLLPTLIHTARNSPASGGHARVINTSSAAIWHPPRGGIAWDTLGTDEVSRKACRRVGRIALYGQSKLGNVLFSNELARRHADQGIVSVSLHPGAIKSELHRHMSGWIPVSLRDFLMDMILHTTAQGAITQLYAGTAPDPKHLNGKFLIPWAREYDPGALANDEQLAQKLWTWCEEQVKES
ncbi:short chain dehydrogenase [Ceratobasidium sp. AG-Ba]|nr:short chain dehydrogenase [Ceratobasidium sp. AG-Ba]